MKEKIHPQYHKTATVSCTCGNTFTVGTTVPSLKVEICSACHPFYTGKQKLIDSGGQLEKFRKRLESVKNVKTARAKKAKAK